MLSSKNKGIFVEWGTSSMLSATTSGFNHPMTIERLHEAPVQEGWEALDRQLEGFVGGKGQRFVASHCSVYPESRFFRRHSIESAAKAKDPKYFHNLISEDLRIDLNSHLATVVNVGDGSEFSLERALANQKEVIIAGMKRDHRDAVQGKMIEHSIYPSSLQLGTLSTLAGLISYKRLMELEQPTLLLEITPEDANLFILTRQQVDVCRPVPFGLNAMFPLIQAELGLKDEASAKKLFFSNTFDFTEMGGKLLRKMLKELQASTGFYEVQTGQTIGQLFVALLPSNLSWVEKVLSRSLGVPTLHIDYPAWLEHHQVRAGAEVQLANLDNRWFGLLSLMLKHERNDDGAA